jgi:histidine triad (HIT) family protein
MPSIFTKIINREIPAYIVAEDEHFISFLDVMPLVEGHALVVPKVEVDYIFDLEATTLANMIVFAQRVAKAIKKSTPCNRVGVAVIGLEVPHAHVHLVPMNTMNDINFTMPKLKLPVETMQAIANRIKANLD